MRRFYIFFMKVRKKHVIAEDCWCKPTIEKP